MKAKDLGGFPLSAADGGDTAAAGTVALLLPDTRDAAVAAVDVERRIVVVGGSRLMRMHQRRNSRKNCRKPHREGRKFPPDVDAVAPAAPGA